MYIRILSSVDNGIGSRRNKLLIHAGPLGSKFFFKISVTKDAHFYGILALPEAMSIWPKEEEARVS